MILELENYTTIIVDRKIISINYNNMSDFDMYDGEGGGGLVLVFLC